VDNVTHALAGLLLAEVAISARRHQGRELSGSARSAVRVASALANNLNDADSLYARHWAGKLGYLLHHRGHTHTLPVGVMLGALVFALVSLGLRFWATKPLTRSERGTLLVLCLLGPFVHIAMDFSNNYGVHPFWPFDDRWFYGDTLFIIEPWLWVFAVPPLCALVESRVLKALLVNLLGFLLILAWFHPMLHWGTAFFLTLGAVVSWRVTGSLRAERRLAFAGAGWVLVAFSFFVGARAARREASQLSLAEAEARGRHERIVDVVVTPTPGNPLCFSALVVASGDDDYLVRAASVSLAPWLLSPTSCHVEPTGFTAAMANPTFASSPNVHWEGEWQRSRSELRALQRENCWAAAMLRFSRVPFWHAWPRGLLVLGDLRYDRLPGEGFAEVHTRQRPGDCPKGVPPWLPPREDLLGP
jgi:inner membrane protein